MELSRQTKYLTHACTLPNQNYLKNLPLRQRIKTKWLDLVCISAESPLARNYFKSNEEIKTEKKKQMDSKHPYYIHPLSKFRAIYEVYLVFFISIMIFSKLTEHGFTRKEIEFFPRHREVSVFLDILSLLDIAINFFSGYINSRKIIEMNPRKIIRNYVLGPYFICDLVSSIPRQIWYIGMTGEQIFEDRMLCFLGVLNILCCFRLVRLITLIQIIYRIDEYFQMKMKNVLFLVCSSMSMLLLLHFFTCLQYGVSRTVRIYFVPRNDRKHDSWIYTNNLYSQSFHVRYLHGFFKSSAYLLGIKMKLYEHKLPEEYALAIITYTTGKILLAFVWVMLTVSILNARKMEIKYQEILDQVSCYIYHLGVPLSLRNRMLDFYNFLYQKQYFKEKDVSAVLPAKLNNEINIHMCYWLIENVQLFSSLSEAEVNAVVSRLRPQIYLPKDYITTTNSTADAMYIISNGTVAVYTHSGKEKKQTDPSLEAEAVIENELPSCSSAPTTTPSCDELEVLNSSSSSLRSCSIEGSSGNDNVTKRVKKTKKNPRKRRESSGSCEMGEGSGNDTLCHLDDGQYFGELGLLMNTNKYATTVVAIEITKVYMLPKKDFYTILLKNSAVSEKISQKARKFARIIKSEEDKYKKMKFQEAFKMRKRSKK